MKFPVVKGFGLLTLIVLISSLGTVGLGTMQHAWASPGITCLVSPLSIVAGGTASWTCWGDPGSSPNVGGVTVLFRSFDDTGAADSFAVFPLGGSSCIGVGGFPTGFAFGGSGGFDGLTDIYIVGDGIGATGNPSLFTIPQSTAAPSLPPIPGAQDSITWTYSAPVFTTTADGVAPAPSSTGTPTWEQIGTGGPPVPLTVGTWVFASCASDSGVGGGPIGTNSKALTVTKPVAGEILPINTTALLIAGASQNGIWILSSLALIAGASFALLRLQIYTKSK